jgi:hypothetical protein
MKEEIKEAKYNYKRKARKTCQLPSLNVTPYMRQDAEKAAEKLNLSLSDYLRMAVGNLNEITLSDENPFRSESSTKA